MQVQGVTFMSLVGVRHRRQQKEMQAFLLAGQQASSYLLSHLALDSLGLLHLTDRAIVLGPLGGVVCPAATSSPTGLGSTLYRRTTPGGPASWGSLKGQSVFRNMNITTTTYTTRRPLLLGRFSQRTIRTLSSFVIINYYPNAYLLLNHLRLPVHAQGPVVLCPLAAVVRLPSCRVDLYWPACNKKVLESPFEISAMRFISKVGKRYVYCILYTKNKATHY